MENYETVMAKPWKYYFVLQSLWDDSITAVLQCMNLVRLASSEHV